MDLSQVETLDHDNLRNLSRWLRRRSWSLVGRCYPDPRDDELRDRGQEVDFALSVKRNEMNRGIA